MCNILKIVVCPFVLFLLAIVLSVLQFTDSDYPFGIPSPMIFTKSLLIMNNDGFNSAYHNVHVNLNMIFYILSNLTIF
jgi:hypothetical protein